MTGNGSKKILVVDDEPVIVKYLVMRLSHRGYEVITAEDGEEAIREAKAQKPDLILLDVKLPKFNGYEVFRRIRADGALAKTPIIFSTADAGVQSAEEEEGICASDYILKPFDAEDLYAKIDKHLPEG